MKTLFSFPETLKNFIISKGPLATFIFFLIQILQIVISPIPGNLTSLAGGALLGWVKASLLSGAAVLIGSQIAFYLARIFGKPLVIKLIGPNVFNKYSKTFSSKNMIALLILFLLPFFPDDALCFLAGLSLMSSKLFLILVFIGRLPSIIVASLAGSGVIYISTEVWITIGIISIIAIYISMKYSNNIEKWLYSKI